jgi:TRAP-type uncharacterized transport system substrate-binding protein
MPELAAALSPLHESRVREAQLLADMLRISRLTVLYGASGTGRTTLLTTGVLPLLRRRAADRKPPQASEPRVVVPFPHCRRSDRTARAEVALFFDEWDGLPLVRLNAWLLSALPSGAGSQLGAPFPSLAENFAFWSKELGVRFLILLDQFEQFLTAPRNRPGIPEFDDEFARVLGDPRLPVNFLVSVREDAEPSMERLRASMTGLGDASLRLYPLDMPKPSALQPRPESLRAATAPALVASETLTGTPPLSEMPAVPSAEDIAVEPAAAEVESETAERPDESEVPPAAEAPAVAFTPAEIPQALDETSTTAGVAALQAARLDEPLRGSPPIDEALQEWAPIDEMREADEVPQASAPPDAVLQGSPPTDDVPQADEVPQASAPPDEVLQGSPPIDDVLQGHEAPQALPRAEEEPRVEIAAAPPPSPKTWMPRLKWAAASGAFVALLFVIWAAQHFPAEPLPLRVTPELQTEAAPPTPAPAEAPPPPNLPPVALTVEPGNSTDAEIARDLARLVAPDAGARIAVRQESAAPADDETPQLAIMRYEALDAASRSKARSAGAPAKLRVVTPLYTEEIYVIVRRDSGLTFIHEIRDRRINVGPERSNRGMTASRLYERMFGAPMQPANVSTLTDDEAMTKLVKDKSLDAMIVVAGQPVKWLKDLAPDLAQSIKLLKLDRTHPIGQKAIEAYLPTSVRAAHYSRWLSEDVPSLATMSFLVTSESSNPVAAERLDAFLRAVCRKAATLRQQGHPKWREVQLGLELETGWPYLASARDAFSACLPR